MELISLNILFKMLKCHQCLWLLSQAIGQFKKPNCCVFLNNKTKTPKPQPPAKPQTQYLQQIFSNSHQFLFSMRSKNQLMICIFRSLCKTNLFYSKVSHSLKLLAANSICSKLLCLTWLVLTRDLTFCSNSSGYLQLPPVCCTGSCSGPLGSWFFSYQDCG